MPLSFEVEMPVLRLEILNRRALIDTMAERVAARVKARAAAGIGDTGQRLPAPKDGGKSYNRTGELVASIGHVMRQLRSGEPYAIVQPIGDRGAHVERKAQIAAARAIGRALQRAAGVDSRAVDKEMRDQLAAARALGRGLARIGRLAGERKWKRAARRVTTQMSLARVLSVAPRDPRGVSGGRGVYRVFTPKQIEVGEMRAIVERDAQVELVQTGTTTRKV